MHRTFRQYLDENRSYGPGAGPLSSVSSALTDLLSLYSTSTSTGSTKSDSSGNGGPSVPSESQNYRGSTNEVGPDFEEASRSTSRNGKALSQSRIERERERHRTQYRMRTMHTNKKSQTLDHQYVSHSQEERRKRKIKENRKRSKTSSFVSIGDEKGENETDHFDDQSDVLSSSCFPYLPISKEPIIEARKVATLAEEMEAKIQCSKYHHDNIRKQQQQQREALYGSSIGEQKNQFPSKNKTKYSNTIKEDDEEEDKAGIKEREEVLGNNFPQVQTIEESINETRELAALRHIEASQLYLQAGTYYYSMGKQKDIEIEGKRGDSSSNLNNMLYSLTKKHSSLRQTSFTSSTKEIYDYNPIVRSLFLLSQYHGKKASMLYHLVQTKQNKKKLEEKKITGITRIKEFENDDENKNIIKNREIEEQRWIKEIKASPSFSSLQKKKGKDSIIIDTRGKQVVSEEEGKKKRKAIKKDDSIILKDQEIQKSTKQTHEYDTYSFHDVNNQQSMQDILELEDVLQNLGFTVEAVPVVYSQTPSSSSTFSSEKNPLNSLSSQPQETKFVNKKHTSQDGETFSNERRERNQSSTKQRDGGNQNFRSNHMIGRASERNIGTETDRVDMDVRSITSENFLNNDNNYNNNSLNSSLSWSSYNTYNTANFAGKGSMLMMGSYVNVGAGPMIPSNSVRNTSDARSNLSGLPYGNAVNTNSSLPLSIHHPVNGSRDSYQSYDVHNSNSILSSDTFQVNNMYHQQLQQMFFHPEDSENPNKIYTNAVPLSYEQQYALSEHRKQIDQQIKSFQASYLQKLNKMKHLLVKQDKSMKDSKRKQIDNEKEEQRGSHIEKQGQQELETLQNHEEANKISEKSFSKKEDNIIEDKIKDKKTFDDKGYHIDGDDLKKGDGREISKDLEKEVELLRQQVKALEAKEKVMSKRLSKANDESAKKTKIIMTYEKCYTDFRKKCQAKTEQAKAQRNGLSQAHNGNGNSNSNRPPARRNNSSGNTSINIGNSITTSSSTMANNNTLRSTRKKDGGQE